MGVHGLHAEASAAVANTAIRSEEGGPRYGMKATEAEPDTTNQEYLQTTHIAV